MTGPLPVSPLAVPFPDTPPVAGVEIAVGRAGFYKQVRDDLLLMRFTPGTACAGVYTRHKVGSAPVDWCRAHLRESGGRARALVVNAGCANSFTGDPGDAAAARVARLAAEAVGCAADEVFMASTGVIGVLLDDCKIAAAMPGLQARLGQDDLAAAARAISTTDTFPKGAFAETEIGGRPVRIAGIAKGSGMVAPNMATVLAFVVTDAAIAPSILQRLLTRQTVRTFNAVTVDGDRSTNDTLMLFATGAAGNPVVTRVTDKRLAAFAGALERVLTDLAQQLARDGEGASKFITVKVRGAATSRSAAKIARTIAESPLVKTAFAGEDANWGRIVMAVGRADEPVRRDRLCVSFGALAAARDGKIADDYSEAAMSAYMKGAELEVSVDVGVGSGAATMWTCDLTKQYVAINGDYRS